MMTLSIFNSRAHAQKLVYEGFMNDKKVGELVATRNIKRDLTEIILDTHVEAHMLVKIVVDLNSKSTHKNDRLIKATSISKTNGSIRSSTKTVLKRNNYVLTMDGKRSTLKNKSLMGADMLYFKEPKNIKKAYALATGEMIKITKAQNGIYYFEHDGKKEFHKYENGILAEVKIDHSLYSITFKLKK